jgi:hypothetical protein
MATTDLKIYVAYEPEQSFQARRIDGWTRTDADASVHEQRGRLRPDTAAGEGERLRAVLAQAIRSADVAVCLISQTAADDPWIDWEIRTARACSPPRPLVGVLLDEYNAHPPAMRGCGAVFVPFKRDTVDRAIRWAFELQATEDDFVLKDF